MTKGAHRQWKQREIRRADLIHGIFSRLAGTGLTYERTFRQARKLGAARWFRAYETFEAYFLRWKKAPRAETLMRKWKGHTRTSSAEFVPAVIKFAAGARVTLREAHRTLGLPLSYNTVFRHCRTRHEINRLAAIRRAQTRLAKEETNLLARIGGKKP